jgi:hypothetical protein
MATFVAGDSAGGNLTLATLLALRDRKRPLPAGGIALSAATDFTLASASLKEVHDPIISARTMSGRVWVHVFQIRGLPESREAIEQIAEFMGSKRSLTKTSPQN